MIRQRKKDVKIGVERMIWIIVADASRAKIFSVNKIKFINGKEKLSLVKELTHPESRLHDLDIVTDKPGRYAARMGQARGSFAEQTEPRKHEVENFACQLANYLEASRAENAFSELILVAPSHFYGVMNKHFHPPLKKVISQVIDKDYTKDTEKELEDHLKSHL